MSLSVQRARKVVPFCTNLALKADHERAVAELAEAQRNATPGMEVQPEVTDAARRVREVEDLMRGHTVEFTLEAWPRKRWVEFEETHKPRDGHEADKVFEIDISSLDEVIAAAIVSVTAQDGTPVPFTPATDWTQLADEMTNGQWEDFSVAVLQLNRGTKSAPFSQAASAVMRRSEQTSKPLSD